MSNPYHLPTLAEFADSAQKECEEEIQRTTKRCRERAQENIAKAEINRQAVALLNGAGITLEWVSSTTTQIKLGFYPNTKQGNSAMAGAVRQLRDALGCKINLAHKEVDDAKKGTVILTLRPEHYDTVRITIIRKLPRKAKCKIVRRRYTDSYLVCEV